MLTGDTASVDIRLIIEVEEELEWNPFSADI